MVLPFAALALACSTVAQDCPAGQMCVAPWDLAKKSCPERGECEPRPAPVELELALPIPAGEHLYCGKGNLAPDTSHSACTAPTRFAFDLISSSFDAPHLILASADGTATARGGCATVDLNDQPGGEDRCNDGWGNYVRVQHPGGVYTQYAHLSAILVHDGARVARGQPIGIEGNTGMAGAKHLHFSAHRGDARAGGPSVPMARLRLAGRTVASSELRCAEWSHGKPPGPANLLVSETRRLPSEERFGFRALPPPAPLPARRCAPGFTQVAPDGCAALPAGRADGVVLFLHGLYPPGAPDEELAAEEALGRSAVAHRLALYAPRGAVGLCSWADDVRDKLCWPSGRGQEAEARKIAQALAPAIDEVARRAGGPARRYLLGFSNGGFFAALIAGEGLLPFDAAAILHGGGAEPSTFDPQRPRPILLVTAEGDPWQGPKMHALDERLARAGWPHRLVVRPGPHRLAPEDAAAALDFFAEQKR